MTAAVVVAVAPALRAGLRAMLEQGGVRVEAAAAQVSEALPREGTLGAADAVMVLAGDVSPDEVDGFGRPVVLLTDDSHQALALRGLGLPGWAVLPADAPAEQLVAAVNAAAQGLAALPAEAAADVLTARVELSDPLREALTPRELEVLRLVSHGLSNKLIARQLNISEHTVKFHVSSTYAKLGAASRTEAVSLAARKGLISL